MGNITPPPWRKPIQRSRSRDLVVIDHELKSWIVLVARWQLHHRCTCRVGLLPLIVDLRGEKVFCAPSLGPAVRLVGAFRALLLFLFVLVALPLPVGTRLIFFLFDLRSWRPCRRRRGLRSVPRLRNRGCCLDRFVLVDLSLRVGMPLLFVLRLLLGGVLSASFLATSLPSSAMATNVLAPSSMALELHRLPGPLLALLHGGW